MKTLAFTLTVLLGLLSHDSLTAQCSCAEWGETIEGYRNYQCDDFGTYNWGEPITSQSSKWSLYPSQSGQSGDANVLYESHVDVLEISHHNKTDVLYDLGGKKGDDLRISWRMTVKNNSEAYYGFHSTANGGTWVFQVYFYPDGTGKIIRGSSSTKIAEFSYNHEEWLNIVHIYNSQTDEIELWISNKFITKWKYSLVDKYNRTLDRFGSINFYANGTSNFWISNLCGYENHNKPLVDCWNQNEPVCVNGTEYYSACEAHLNGYTSLEWTEGSCNSGPGGNSFCEDMNVIYQEDFEDKYGDYIAKSQPNWWREGNTLQEKSGDDLDAPIRLRHNVDSEMKCISMEPYDGSANIVFKGGRMDDGKRLLSFDLETDMDYTSYNEYRTLEGGIVLRFIPELLDAMVYEIDLNWDGNWGGNSSAAYFKTFSTWTTPTSDFISDMPILYSKNWRFPYFNFEFYINIENNTIELRIDDESQFIIDGSKIGDLSGYNLECEFIVNNEPRQHYLPALMNVDNFLFSECGQPRHNYDPIEVDLGQAQCQDPGTLIKIPIRVRNCEDVSSFQFSVDMLDNNAGYIESIDGKSFDGNPVRNNIISGKSAIITWAGTKDITIPDNWVIANLYIRLSQNHRSKSIIRVTSHPQDIYFLQNGRSANVKTYNGSVEVCKNTLINICGTIYREDGQPINNVTVWAFGQNSQSSSDAITNINGEYCFQLPNDTYKIVPEKNTYHQNGVDTRDLALINSHVLFARRFNNPYKVIAADATNDEKVYASDVSEVLRLVLGAQNEFRNNQSWRFVDANHQFQQSNNPFDPDFPEFINVNQTSHGVDFNGIKIGDVTNDNDPSDIGPNNNDTRSSSDVSVQYGKPYKKSVNLFAIPVILINNTDVSDIFNLQFTSEWSSQILDFENISFSNSSINAKDYNFIKTESSDGKLGFAWYDEEAKGVTMQDTMVLFEILFNKSVSKNAKIDMTFSNGLVDIKAGSLDNVLSIDTKDASFFVTTSIKNLAEKISVTIYPNPTANMINIGLGEGTKTMKQVELIDISGKVIRSSNINSNDSNIRWNIQNETVGTYFLKLSGSEGIATYSVIKK